MKNIEGTKDYSTADVYSGIIKNIEHLSHADHAYDTALAHAVEHGFGFFYLTNRWSRSDPFVQELAICRVKDSYSVYLDPSAEEADLSDAQDAFMFTNMTRRAFEAKYPHAVAASFSGGATGAYQGWWDAETIRVAQYWLIEYRDDEVLMLSNGKTVYLKEVEPVLDELEQEWGIHVATDSRGREYRKKVKRPICTWRKLTGVNVLEGPIDLPFESVPIFAVLGDERIVEGDVRYESATRHAKDPQRSFNYWRTSAAETVALQPRAPYIATERQIAGYEHVWESANQDNPAVLYYNHIEGIPAPHRDFAPNGGVAELALATQDARDMQTIIGLHDASLGRESNEKSGKAIERRQAQGLTSTYQFPDNLSRALTYMGRCAVYAIPRIYDTRRIMRIRLPDDTEDFVQINSTIEDKDTGKKVLVHDLGVGRYDVVMETGIDYNTQRQEARDTQLEILKVLGPEQAANIVHLVVENVGGPGSDKIARVLRKLLPDELKSPEEKRADLPPGVTMGPDGTPVDEKTGQPYQRPPTPQEELLAAQAQAEQAEAQAKIAKADADKVAAEATKIEAQARTVEAQAKIAEVQAGGAQAAQQQKQQQARDQQFLKDVEKIVRTVMTEHEQNPGAHKEAIQQAVAEGAADALERVRAYLDKTIGGRLGKLEETEQRRVESERFTKAVDAEAARRAKAPAAETRTAPPRVKRFGIAYDPDGNVTELVPEYDDDEAA
jgi:hypothetical protein